MQTIYHALAALNDLYYDLSFEEYQEVRQDLEEQVKRELPGFTIGHAQILRERFTSGLLSQFRPLRQWVVWKPEQDMRGNVHKVPYHPGYHFEVDPLLWSHET